jgi:mRNA-degrading endonuclease YafQ of YafQ-DinJ toxin-antitoxin module
VYALSLSAKFQKQLGKLVKGNSSLSSQFKKAVKLLAKNPKTTSLRLHKIKGEDYWSVSVNRSIRILIKFEDNKIYLLEIGTHDEVY